MGTQHLAHTDFAELWRQKAPLRRTPDVPAKWNERIAETPKHYAPGTYSADFVARAGIVPGETVFDMGCGAGTLAIPCALMGCPVTAMDFSQGMLDQLETNRLEHHVPDGLITPVLGSWTDDWATLGLAPKSHDVALASRSIITADLEDSLRRLNAIARRKVCVTAVAGCSPRSFPALVRDLGLTPDGHQDAAFVYAICCDLGYQPEVTYLDSIREDLFATPEDAFKKYAKMIDLTHEEPQGAERLVYEERLRAWLDEHLVQVKAADYPRRNVAIPADATMLTPDVTRAVSWAFISWNVR